MTYGRGGGEPTGPRLGRIRLRRPGSGRRRHSVTSIILASLAVLTATVLVGGTLTAYLVFRRDWNDINRISVLKDLGKQLPPADPNALNILLIGSDSRAGPNKQFGAEVEGQRSDTVMVVHIAPGAHQVIVLSLPRDTMVPILSCTPEPGAPGQQAQPGQVEQINATFAAGGAGCLWKTIEQTTHLHLDHFIELNFTGFEKVIDDVGGVSICLPFPVDDPLSRLDLTAGVHHVYGAQALAFWRARYIGEGSDLQRIRRDQYLMASLLQGVERSDITSSPGRLLSVISDAAKSMTTDAGLSPSAMISIVDRLRGLPPGSVQFIELPTVPYQPNPDWVSWPASDAGLFSAFAHDRTLSPAALTGGSARPTAAASPTQVPAGAPPAAGGQAARSSRPGDPRSFASLYGGITGSTDVCHDGAAFTGPRGGS